MKHNRYAGDVRRAQVEKNLAHVRQVKAQKAAILAALKRRSEGEKERRS